MKTCSNRIQSHLRKCENLNKAGYHSSLSLMFVPFCMRTTASASEITVSGHKSDQSGHTAAEWLHNIRSSCLQPSENPMAPQNIQIPLLASPTGLLPLPESQCSVFLLLRSPLLSGVQVKRQIPASHTPGPSAEPSRFTAAAVFCRHREAAGGCLLRSLHPIAKCLLQVQADLLPIYLPATLGRQQVMAASECSGACQAHRRRPGWNSWLWWAFGE